MKSIYLAVAGVGLAALLALATLSLSWVWPHRASYPSVMWNTRYGHGRGMMGSTCRCCRESK